MRKTASPYLIYAHAIFISLTAIVSIWASAISAPINYPDTETYELPVLEFFTGAGVSMFVRPVGYPFFIGVIYKLFGASREFVIYAQQAIGVLGYILHYLAFRYFIRREGATVLAFIVSISGTLIFYERAVLADFLNYLALLVSLLFFFKYYAKGERPVYLAVSSFFALFAYLIRPNSLLLAAIVAAFLILETLFRRGERGRRLFHLAIYSAVFAACLLAADLVTYAATGRMARPVGVGAPTLLSRVAEHIDYGSAPHHAIKERYRVLRIQHQIDFDKDQFTADASAAYELMTEIECADPAGKLAEYRAAARSAENHYGTHALNSYYFTIYDIFRTARCDIRTINGIFKEIAVGALLTDPAGYAKSVLLSAWDYILIPSSDYGGIIEIQSAEGQPSVLIKAFAFIGSLFAQPAVTAALLLIFAASGAFHFISQDRNTANYRLLVLLTAYLVATYLSTAVFMNVLSPRYKLPAYWVQLLLLCVFVRTSLARFLRKR